MKIKSFIAAALAALSLHTSAQNEFIRTSGTHFFKGNSSEPYYFMGTNLWYGPILGSTGEGGNRSRLCAELDSLRAIGITNLRILAGADAGSKYANTVKPYLQTEPGVLNDTLLAGLDFMLCEMQKREMVAVIYLTNSWDWSGGYGFYLRAIGHGDSPDSHNEGYNDYVQYARKFFSEQKAQELFFNHVKAIVSRKNSITGKPYRDDPTIMSWQLCNEPRPFGREEESEFLKWVSTSAALIKAIDPNHLVSTGSEGVIGCNVDEDLCKRVHNDPNIDYMTVHIWPANWRWASKDRLFDALPNVYNKSAEYLQMHDRIAFEINKPYVVEEFGYPRDNNFHGAGSPTVARDAFYNFVFSKLRESKNSQGAMAGCNFWGWGGSGRPQNETWTLGADYLCDPPHEPQGWYSVFDNDESTIKLISNALK